MSYKYKHQEPAVSKVTGFRVNRGGRLPETAIRHIYKQPASEVDLGELRNVLTRLLKPPKK